MRSEYRNVVPAFAKRRDLQGKNAQPVVQIRAEPPLMDQVIEVVIGGGNDAHLGLTRAVTTDRLKLAVLQHTEQLGLHLQRQIADLVEKKRTAVCQLKAPDSIRHGSAKGTLNVAEQLAFEQLSGNRTAVELDQGTLTPRTVLMDGAGHQLLADAGLAQNKYGSICWRDHFNLLEDAADSGAAAQNFVSAGCVLNLLTQIGILGLEKLTQPINLIESARIGDRRRRRRGKDAQPFELNSLEQQATKNGDHAQHLAPIEQRLGGEAANSLLRRPFGLFDPLVVVASCLNQYGFGGGTNLNDLASAPVKLTIQSRPVFAVMGPADGTTGARNQMKWRDFARSVRVFPAALARIPIGSD